MGPSLSPGFTAEPITASLLTLHTCLLGELDVCVRAQLFPLVCEFLCMFPGLEQTFNKRTDMSGEKKRENPRKLPEGMVTKKS